MSSTLNKLFNKLLQGQCKNQDAILVNVINLKQLSPDRADFSDEYFGSLSPIDRQMAYVYIRALWPQIADEIFRRRLDVEGDPICKRALLKMLKIVTEKMKMQTGEAEDDADIFLKNERVPDYRQTLRKAIFQFLKNPRQFEASIPIMKLKPTDADFDDVLLDTMTAKDRLEVYLMLLMWCGSSNLKRILERRAKIEKDEDCLRIISLLLPSLCRLV